MITFAICEDEPYFLLKLKKFLDFYAAQKQMKIQVKPFRNGETLLKSSLEFDILLMDIRLPGEDGIQITRRFREAGSRSQFIFITAYREYIFYAFDLDAVHYLVKPVTQEALFPVLDKAIRRLDLEQENAVVITKSGRALKIRCREILYCEALDHQITIHTLTGEIQFFGTLDDLQGRLDSRFFRCHRSFLVNLHFVADLQTGFAVMENGASILIARRRQQEFLHRFLEACRKGVD